MWGSPFLGFDEMGNLLFPFRALQTEDPDRRRLLRLCSANLKPEGLLDIAALLDRIEQKEGRASVAPPRPSPPALDRDEWGKSCIHWACLRGNYQLLLYLLESVVTDEDFSFGDNNPASGDTNSSSGDKDPSSGSLLEQAFFHIDPYSLLGPLHWAISAPNHLIPGVVAALLSYNLQNLPIEFQATVKINGRDINDAGELAKLKGVYDEFQAGIRLGRMIAARFVDPQVKCPDSNFSGSLTRPPFLRECSDKLHAIFDASDKLPVLKTLLCRFYLHMPILWWLIEWENLDEWDLNQFNSVEFRYAVILWFLIAKKYQLEKDLKLRFPKGSQFSFRDKSFLPDLSSPIPDSRMNRIKQTLNNFREKMKLYSDATKWEICSAFFEKKPSEELSVRQVIAVPPGHQQHGRYILVILDLPNLKLASPHKRAHLPDADPAHFFGVSKTPRLFDNWLRDLCMFHEFGGAFHSLGNHCCVPEGCDFVLEDNPLVEGAGSSSRSSNPSPSQIRIFTRVYPENLNQYLAAHNNRLDPRRKALSINSRLSLALDILCAIDGMHSRGFQHGDLKTTNIFVSIDQQVETGKIERQEEEKTVTQEEIKARKEEKKTRKEEKARTPSAHAFVADLGTARDFNPQKPIIDPSIHPQALNPQQAQPDILRFGYILFCILTLQTEEELLESRFSRNDVNFTIPQLFPIVGCPEVLQVQLCLFCHRCIQDISSPILPDASELLNQLKEISNHLVQHQCGQAPIPHQHSSPLITPLDLDDDLDDDLDSSSSVDGIVLSQA